MVFRGKPSSSCKLCRERKIKCDQVRPACSQCIRVKSTCSGYRDLQDLVFRDETDSILRRAGLPSSPQTCPLVPSSICGTPQPPIDDVALAYFCSRFVTPYDCFSALKKDFVSDVIREGTDTLALASMVSVGMAALANINRSSIIASLARRKYVLALSLTRTALGNITFAHSRTVLASVLLLAMFETISATSPMPLRSWYQHLDGALNFLHALKSDQLAATVGMNAVFHLRRQILISRAQRRVTVPRSICGFVDSLKPMMSPDELLYHSLCSIQGEFINLRASMEEQRTIKAEYVLRSLVKIDSELETWASCLPVSWAYSTLPCIPGENFYSTTFYMHSNYRNATIWNEYCTTRLLVNDLLLNSLDHCLLTRSKCEERIFHTLQRVCNDVCANAPYFLGRVKGLPMFDRSLGGYYFLWSLFICACMPRISDYQRSWATKQLKIIGHEMGINLALLLADLMEKKPHLVHGGGSGANLPKLVLYDHVPKILFSG